MLDVFSSAFWTHPAYAHSVIRNCDEELAFTAKAAGVHIFQPPRSMDVVYNMFAVVDLPGLVNIATVDGVDYEVISHPSKNRRYSFEARTEFNTEITLSDGSTLQLPVIKPTSALRQLIDNAVNADHLVRVRITSLNDSAFIGQTSTLYEFNLGKSTNNYIALPAKGLSVGDPEPPAYNFATSTGEGMYECITVGVVEEVEYDITDYNTETKTRYDVEGSSFVYGNQPHYVDAVGQWLIQDVEMTIGGARVGLLNSLYMYIHEELFGRPGRRQEDMIGKVAAYEPEAQREPDFDVNNNERDGAPFNLNTVVSNANPFPLTSDAGRDELETKSMTARRLYVQLPFWWTGGKMERALKTIALQLHKIEFKIQTRKLEDCIAYGGSNLSGNQLPSAGKVYELTGPLSHAVNPLDGGVTSTTTSGQNGLTTDVTRLNAVVNTYVRRNEHIAPSNNAHLIGPVRRAAGGEDVILLTRHGVSSKSDEESSGQIRAYLQVDFCGIFLNQDTRDVYLKLDEKTLFSQVLGTDTRGTSLDDSKAGQQTETLNFSNAVYDIMVGVRSLGAASEYGDTFGLRGTSLDKGLGIRDDALKTLSFDISSTPRTIAHLSAEYYRHVTQFQAAKVMSPLKGLYYYNVQLFDELNGTRTVNSYINASKIDDLRCRYEVNNDSYSDKTLLSKQVEMHFFAHVYNTLQIRNGMAGAMFA